ncbi:uncharacterized protein TRAVEDRAFT_22369 [Trametes versicolor FP-101664 SS1]|uniref:uncharacterized protein n=1 Tax=Trametes versicolor (strain FP-101664) TaxID=717944 RepID=UPI0004623F32|nr:uncharacterized protein TRAVEDRAFT_22369 [Trametes versicolor FP-101664 SS1]EIW55974.1 hypothetical protein TRAVEDRAFT_22369 [Trametes versicolor FP-101664 SS1]
MSSYTPTTAGPSTAPTADFTFLGNVFSTTLVDKPLHSPTTRAAILSHTSSMGSTGEEGMRALAATQQHQCPASCGSSSDETMVKPWYSDIERLSSHYAPDENIPLSTYDPDFPHYYGHYHTAAYPRSEAFLSNTQGAAAPDLYTTPDLHAPSPFEKRYPFVPSTSSILLGATHIPVWQAPELSFPPSHYAPASLSHEGTVKRLFREDEDDIVDDAPASKRSRLAGHDTVESQMAVEEGSTSGADLSVGALADVAEDEDFQNEEPEEDVVSEAEDSEAESEEQISEAEDEDEEATEEEEEPTPRTKRSRRTKDEVLKTTRRLPRGVPCPVQGCTKPAFNPYDHVGNRKHIVTHLERAAVIECPWPVCEDTRDSQNLMIHHITDVHIGFPYICLLDDRCTWGSTKSQWQTQHMQRDCKYRPM